LVHNILYAKPWFERGSSQGLGIKSQSENESESDH
jgi:hypothetical protein